MNKLLTNLFALIIILSTPWVSAQDPDFSGIKLVIDPGHGGHESDDRGMPNGFWESESNFTKATWLMQLLEDRGCEVILTRYGNDDDVADDPGLSARAQVAIDNGADMFISVHSNAANQRSNYPLTIFNGKTDAPTIPASKDWAITLWEHLKVNQSTCWTGEGRYIGDLTLNPSWTSGYGVLVPLIRDQITSLISEGSFHDYQPEMDRLLNLDYRRQEAYHIFYAMVDFFGLDGRESLGNISGIVRDSLLEKDYYTLPGMADAYENVNGTLVRLLETGEEYQVDDLNTGFYMFDSLAPGPYTLVFSAPSYFNDTVDVNVTAHQFTYYNHWMHADKTMPPKITKFSPDSGALAIPCFDPVTLRFSMNMDSATVAGAFSMTPAVEGTWTWDDKYLNASFQPDIPYEKETLYTVELDSTAEHQWGVSMDTTISFSFTTDSRNRYLVEGTYPAEGQDLVSPYAQIRVLFDAPVNSTSLINAAWFEAGDGSQMGTKGAEISEVDGKGHYYFSPADNLSWDSDYTLVLSGTIKDENGIPMVDTFEVNFRTMADPGELFTLDEMDDPETWAVDQASSQGIDATSFLYRWTRDMISGDASTLLRYKFLSADATCQFAPGTPLWLHPSFDECGLWIWGEMSGQGLVIGFDNGAEATLGDIDFPGWAYRKVSIPEGATTVSHLRLERKNPLVEGGDLMFDLLHQPGSIVGMEVEGLAQFRVYPNPVRDGRLYLHGLPDTRVSYALYNLSGARMQEGMLTPGTNQIDLKPGLPEVLILRVDTPEGNLRQLIINEKR